MTSSVHNGNVDVSSDLLQCPATNEDGLTPPLGGARCQQRKAILGDLWDLVREEIIEINGTIVAPRTHHLA